MCTPTPTEVCGSPRARVGPPATTTFPSSSSLLPRSSCEDLALSALPKHAKVTAIQLLATRSQSPAPTPAGMQAVQAGHEMKPLSILEGALLL